MATAVQPVAPPAKAAPPAAPATPSPKALDAPAPDVSQSGPFGVDNALDAITKESIAKTLAEQAPAPETPQRNEKGQFVKADGTAEESQQPTTQTQVAKPGAPLALVPSTAPGEGEVADEGTFELPEGFVLAPKIEGRELKTQFKVLGKDGTELEIPELTIAFKANGKDRSASLDHVVKMAEWGVYNQERHEQMERAVQDTQTVRAQLDQVSNYARRLESERDQLLSDDNTYLRARAQWEQQNTPEARNQRDREQIEQERQQVQIQQVHQAGTQFYQSELLPAVNTMAKALPQVSDEEIGAKLLLISDRFKVQTPWGAVIPPAQYPAIRNAILSDVVPWAQQLNDHREHERAAATKEHTTKATTAEAKARTAQIDAQKAKSLVGRVTRPAARGTNGQGTTPSTRDAAKPAVPNPKRSVDEAEAEALRDTLAAVMGTS